MLQAQTITGFQAENMQDSVAITYTLVDSFPGRSYGVSLFGIRGTDTVALELLRGAVGDTILPGTHQIYWRSFEEWQRYRGPVAFYLRAMPNFSFSVPQKDNKVYKRDKPVSFRWYGQNAHQDSLKVELFQYDEKIDSLTTLADAYTYTWKIPMGLRQGEGYRIKLTGTDKTELEAFSPYFAVKRRFPLYVLIAPPVAVVAGVVAAILLTREPLPLAPQPE